MKEPCPLFDTKPENVPVNLLGAISAAEELKENAMLGMLPNLGSVTAFEYECYKSAKYAENAIEAEELEEMQNNSGATPNTPEKFGANNEPSPFANWDK